MKPTSINSILDRYDSWKQVPVSVKAMLNRRADRENKSRTMVAAGYKAAFARRANKQKNGSLHGCPCKDCHIRARLNKITQLVK